jgi:hypothetical protein
LLTDDNILTIYNSPDLIKVCKKLYGQDWEELRSIVIERIIHKTELENTNMIAYSIQCAYNTFKNKIKRNIEYTTQDALNQLPNPPSKLDYLKFIDTSLSMLIKKVNEDKNNIALMYKAHTFDVYMKNDFIISRAQKQIKLSYHEVYTTIKEYEQYLKDYFKNKI